MLPVVFVSASLIAVLPYTWCWVGNLVQEPESSSFSFCTCL